MGMVCVFSTISDESIKLVRQHPLLLMKWFGSEEEFQEYIESRQASKAGFFAKLFRRKPKPIDPLPEYSPCGNENIQNDTDKAWHGIHFMLTGSVSGGEEPLNFLVAGGETIKDFKIGYGQARVFTAGQVKCIDNALQAISKAEFESRFDPQKMKKEGVYSMGYNAPEDDLSYVCEYFLTLKQYIHTISDKNMGLVVAFT